MKEEELIRKLKNAKLPEIEMPSHQRALKMALLSAGCPRRRRGFFPYAFLAVIKGGIEIIMKGLLTKQPVWKTASFSLLGLALVLGLSFALPPMFTGSVYAEAENIVQNSPEVRAVLGSSANESLEIIDLFLLREDGTVSVVVKGSNDAAVTASVDPEAAKVVEVTPMGLTKAVREEVLAIAGADPAIKKLLDKGASFLLMSYVYTITDGTQTTGVERLQPLLRVIIEEADGTRWTAEIDVESKQVSNLRPQPEMFMAPMDTATPYTGTGTTFSVNLDSESAGPEMTVTMIEILAEKTGEAPPTGIPMDDPATRIAKADPKVKELLDKGGNIIAGFQADVRMNEAGEITEAAPLPTVIIELDGRFWYAEIDIEAKKVTGPPVEIDTATLKEEFGIYIHSGK